MKPNSIFEFKLWTNLSDPKEEAVRTLKLPKHGKILGVGLQARALVLYVLGNIDDEQEERVFVTLMWGSNQNTLFKDYKMKYVGTVCFGSYSEHVFENLDKKMLDKKFDRLDLLGLHPFKEYAKKWGTALHIY